MGKLSELVKDLSSSISGPPPAPNGANTGNDGPPWLGHVAMLTGALAALAGFLTVRSTMLTNEAIYESNQAILSQTQASDAWSEYEAESIKAHMAEMQLLMPALTPDSKTQLENMGKDLRGREPDLKKSAEEKALERDDHLNRAKFQLGEKDLLGYASVAAQLSIALASVAALIRKRSVFHLAAGMGAVAVGLTAYTFITDYLASR